MSERGLTAASEGRSTMGDRQWAIESGRSTMGDHRKRAIIGSGRLKSRRHRRNPPARVEEIGNDCD